MSIQPPKQSYSWLAGMIGCLLTFGMGARGLAGRLFTWIPGDQGDAALNNWILERNLQYGLHGGHWLKVADLFTTNSFWPETNTLAWSDNWLVLTPVYGALRLAVPPGQAFALLIALCLTANVVACYRLCRHATDHTIYRLVAACLAGFSLAILARLGHAQLMPAFAGLLSIDAALAAITCTAEPAQLEPEQRRISISVDGVLNAVLWLLLQLAIGFYQGVFFALAATCLLTALLLQPIIWQGTTLTINWSAFTRSHARTSLLWRSSAMALLMGINGLIYRQYFLFSREVGKRPWDEVASMIPKVWSFGFNVLSNPGNVSLPAPVQSINANTYPGAFWEHSLFPGYTYALLLGVGLWLGWRGVRSHGAHWPWRLMLLGQTCLLMLLVSLGLGGRNQLITAWALLYQWVPGISALRAVSRIGLALALLASPILAWSLSELHRRLGRKQMFGVLAMLLALYLAGNVVTPGLPRFASRPYEARVKTVSQRVDHLINKGNCKAFYLAAATQHPPEAIESQLMAMWASLHTGYPTVSGYSGHQPADGWTPAMTEAELRTWLGKQGVNAAAIEEVCWLSSNQVLEPQAKPAGNP